MKNGSEMSVKLPDIKNQRHSRESLHDISNIEDKSIQLRAKLEALYSGKPVKQYKYHRNYGYQEYPN